MNKDLSPKEFARVIGVGESSVKRWADSGQIKVTRTEGGHRRISIHEAIQYIHTNKINLADPAPLGITGMETISGKKTKFSNPDDFLEESIIAGNIHNVQDIVSNMYLKGTSIAEICDGPITSAMHHVGELWHHNVDGIVIEHRATATCVQALSYLRSMIAPPAKDAPIAVGCAVEDDPYLLPSWMAASTLADEGWNTINLGPDLPASALLSAIHEYSPRLVWVSISANSDKKKLTKQFRNMLEKVDLHEITFIAGGRASEPLKGLNVSLHYGNSMGELAAFAKGLLATNPGASSIIQS